MIKPFFICFLFILVGSLSFSNSPGQRVFNENKIESLINEVNFEYENNATATYSWLDSLGKWFSKHRESILGFLSNLFNIPSIVFEIIFYGFIIISIVFLIIQILGSQRTLGFFRSKKRIKTTEYSIVEESIENVDFRALIEEAQQTKNYTLVVRYYYLYALQVLSENQAIGFHIRKTNSDYERELRDTKISVPFSKMASLFEYIWYGNYAAESNHCQRMAENLNQLKSEVN